MNIQDHNTTDVFPSMSIRLDINIYLYITLARHRSPIDRPPNVYPYTPVFSLSLPEARMGNLKFGGSAKLSQVAPAAMKTSSNQYHQSTDNRISTTKKNIQVELHAEPYLCTQQSSPASTYKEDNQTQEADS